MLRYLITYQCLNDIADGFDDGEVTVDAESAHEAREIAQTILLARHKGIICNVRDVKELQLAAHRVDG